MSGLVRRSLRPPPHASCLVDAGNGVAKPVFHSRISYCHPPSPAPPLPHPNLHSHSYFCSTLSSAASGVEEALSLSHLTPVTHRDVTSCPRVPTWSGAIWLVNLWTMLSSWVERFAPTAAVGTDWSAPMIGERERAAIGERGVGRGWGWGGGGGGCNFLKSAITEDLLPSLTTCISPLCRFLSVCFCSSGCLPVCRLVFYILSVFVTPFSLLYRSASICLSRCVSYSFVLFFLCLRLQIFHQNYVLKIYKKAAILSIVLTWH